MSFMSSLDDKFAELVERLSSHRGLSAGGDDPFYYFVFPPSKAQDVRRNLPAWRGKLQHAGWNVQTVSFADLIWKLVDESGRWDTWLEAEADFAPADITRSIRDVVSKPDGLIARVRDIVSHSEPQRLVLFTDTETLNPFFRVRGLENELHDQVKSPTVILYPGGREGQYGLRYLGLYDNDPNYRATVLGG
jgi:hypothetical protein